MKTHIDAYIETHSKTHIKTHIPKDTQIETHIDRDTHTQITNAKTYHFLNLSFKAHTHT